MQASNELTVWCVNIGTKYHPDYVYALKEMVDKYLTIPHEFKCITTLHLPDIFCVKPHLPYQGWWSKINLFSKGMATGPSLYFDLDVLIVKNINYLANYTQYKFAAPANWAMSGHGGVQSSVMAWRGDWTEPADRIKPLWKDKLELESGHTMIANKAYWGDQEWIGYILGDDWMKIEGIGSYKYHCRQNIPDWLKVMVFHGNPKPHEVNDKWISHFIPPTLHRIKGNILSGSVKGQSATA